MEASYDELLNYLKEINQPHIIELFNVSSEIDKKELKKQIDHLNKIYPGGIKEYINRAKYLLENSKNNVNPYSSFSPSIPEGIDIIVGDNHYFELESVGFEELSQTGFVLVAGGLGERLGYNDIKVGIQTDLISQRVFLKVYIEYLLAYEQRMRTIKKLEVDFHVPLCIMTSDDTHLKTIDLLEANNYFGYKKENLTIVKQEKVPALLDNDCKIALVKDKLLIDTKPHGHGDVHTLLYQNGVVEKWQKQGKKWVVFFQDTNILVFNCLPSAIGVSKKNGYVINSITIPRKPGDNLGGICKLTDNSNNKSITLNVEYNQLDSLLRDKWNPKGDIANEKGLSHFPGNTNVLVFELDSYFKTLKKNKGLMPEFVNPKYADESKTTFKSPTRLECMMQDYPQLLTENEKVGFTMYERWFCFSTCKNNLKDGTDRLKKGLLAETSFSCEQDIYSTNIKIMRDVLGKLEIIRTDEIGEEKVNIMGVDIYFGPKIVIFPDFAVTVKELRDKISGKISLTNRSVLLLESSEEKITNLTLDGFLRVTREKKLEENLNITNHIRYDFISLKEGEGENYETVRGYRCQKNN